MSFDAVSFDLVLFDPMSVNLVVCLYPINVKTDEKVGSIFFVGSHVTPGKVHG